MWDSISLGALMPQPLFLITPCHPGRPGLLQRSLMRVLGDAENSSSLMFHKTGYRDGSNPAAVHRGTGSTW